MLSISMLISIIKIGSYQYQCNINYQNILLSISISISILPFLLINISLSMHWAALVCSVFKKISCEIGFNTYLVSSSRGHMWKKKIAEHPDGGKKNRTVLKNDDFWEWRTWGKNNVSVDCSSNEATNSMVPFNCSLCRETLRMADNCPELHVPLEPLQNFLLFSCQHCSKMFGLYCLCLMIW